MAWLKALHIAALAVWCAGLIYLPVLILARRGARHGAEYERLCRVSRFNFTAITSPAAFLAIASGAALLFIAPGVMEGWMFLKLVFVGLMALAHTQYGTILAHMARFEPAPRLRLILVTGVSALSIGAVLVLVLAKPAIASDWLPDWMTEPGGLQSLFRSVTAN